MMNLIANGNVLFISFLPKEGSARMAIPYVTGIAERIEALKKLKQFCLALSATPYCFNDIPS